MRMRKTPQTLRYHRVFRKREMWPFSVIVDNNEEVENESLGGVNIISSVQYYGTPWTTSDSIVPDKHPNPNF